MCFKYCCSCVALLIQEHWKTPEFPLARIKKIMRIDEDVKVLLYRTYERIKDTLGAAILSFVGRLSPFSSEVKNVLVFWESEHLGPLEASFIERLFLLCPLI